MLWHGVVVVYGPLRRHHVEALKPEAIYLGYNLFLSRFLKKRNHHFNPTAINKSNECDKERKKMAVLCGGTEISPSNQIVRLQCDDWPVEQQL